MSLAPYAVLERLASPARHGFVLVLFADGAPLDSYEDPTGLVVSRVSDAAAFGGDVYFASPSSVVLTRVPAAKVDHDPELDARRRRPRYVAPSRGAM